MTAATAAEASADRTPGAPAEPTFDIPTALARADRAWCRETADEHPVDPGRLDYYAYYLEPMLTTAPTPTNHPDVEQLRAEADALRRQLADAQREADTWLGEYERVVDEKLVDVAEDAELRQQQRDLAMACVARLVLEATGSWDPTTNLVQQVEAAERAIHASRRPRHRHAWEWQPGLKRMPLPCSCGLPWPSDRPPGGA